MRHRVKPGINDDVQGAQSCGSLSWILGTFVAILGNTAESCCTFLPALWLTGHAPSMASCNEVIFLLEKGRAGKIYRLSAQRHVKITTSNGGRKTSVLTTSNPV
mmetsp:Transcript_26124/g.35242  ORF Transcript_26124/g.35242 Transcript_26124/m.35242 type:complete len:104 (+) Transcript_26124:89-400(+)